MSGTVDVVVVGAGQAGLATSHELAQRGRRARRPRARPDRRRPGAAAGTASASSRRTGPCSSRAAPTTGDDPDGFMPRDEIVAYLERYAAASGARPRGRRRSRSIEPARRRLRRCETSAGELRARSVVLAHRRVPAATPPRRRADSLPAEPAPDRRRGLPERGDAARRAGARRRQRAVGLPDRRGAARGRPRGGPLVRAGAVGAAPARRPRPRLVAGRDRASSTAGRRRCRLPTARLGANLARHRPRRRPRPAPPDAPSDGRDAARPLPRGRRSSRAIRARPRRERRLGRRAVPRSSWTSSASSPPSGGCRTGDRRSRAVRRRRARGASSSRASARSSSPAASAPTTRSGSACPARSTSSASRSSGRREHGRAGLFFVGVHFLRKRKSSLLFGVGEDAAIVARQIAALG